MGAVCVRRRCWPCLPLLGRAAAIVGAWLLGRSRLTPLEARDPLLFADCSTFSWTVLLLFAAFVAVFEWRSRVAPPVDGLCFNALQTGMALLAIVAVFAVVAAVPRGNLSGIKICASKNRAVPGSSMNHRCSCHSPGYCGGTSSAWVLWGGGGCWIRWAWQVFTRDGLWRRYVRPAAAPPAVGPPH